ncbi:hypothetical protein [Roseovarius phycicola]|uniref:PilZ domain-containing protein n=1 Tax=Roseovarius phycicola TaxID=3080976 RepID=A0ABZ2HHG7_9RHOB
MAQITRYPFASHLRAEASSHIRHYREGKIRREGRGLSFWFDPTRGSIIEVPLADRELTFLVKSQSSDYQDLAVQGTVLWRVARGGCGAALGPAGFHPRSEDRKAEEQARGPHPLCAERIVPAICR